MAGPPMMHGYAYPPMMYPPPHGYYMPQQFAQPGYWPHYHMPHPHHTHQRNQSASPDSASGSDKEQPAKI